MGLVLHGGAGAMPRDQLTPEREAAIRAELERALRAAHTVLANGGSSVDAVSAGIVILEDSPYFNAGKGAVFTHDGINELDASIGGVIALDRDGHFALSFNTPGMYRGYIGDDGVPHIAIYK